MKKIYFEDDIFNTLVIDKEDYIVFTQLDKITNDNHKITITKEQLKEMLEKFNQ